jgi:regulator of sigma E protease
MTIIQSALASFGPFFLLLGLLIFVHELGHFLVAKFFGVRVETFSLGFGKKIFCFKKGETTYAISLIPLGGYVKMFGDDPNASIPDAEKDRAFLFKPLPQRIAVVLAGPLMNLVFAFAIFAAIAGLGEDMPGSYVGDIPTNSTAYSQGFRSGDHIVAVNGEKTPTWNLVQRKIGAAGERALEFLVERTGEAEPLKFEASTVWGDNDNIFSPTRRIGQIPGLTAESRSTVVGVSDAHGAAAQAGIQSLDLIEEVDGAKVSHWRDLEPAFAAAVKAGDKIVNLKVRDLQKDDKAEASRSVQMELPAGLAADSGDVTARLGLESAELYIFQIKKDSPADKAGIQAKDKVVSIDGQAIQTWDEVLKKVKSFDPAANKTMAFTVVRDGSEKTFEIRPEMTELMSIKGQEEKRYTIGIVSGYFPVGPQPVFYRLSNPLEILTYGCAQTWEWTEFVVMSMVRLIQGEVSAKNVGGVITIGRVASQSFAAGLSTFLKTMAIISINLFLLNLLPIPILDGGHLLFYTIEGLQGAPLSMRKMELAQQVGLMLLMFLMVFAFYNDIANYFANRW